MRVTSFRLLLTTALLVVTRMTYGNTSLKMSCQTTRPVPFSRARVARRATHS